MGYLGYTKQLDVHLFSFVFIIFHPLELRLEAKYSPAEVDCSWAFLLNAMVHKIHSPGFGLADSGDAAFLHQLIITNTSNTCSSYKFLK